MQKDLLLSHPPGRCDTGFSHPDCRSVLILIVAPQPEPAAIDAATRQYLDALLALQDDNGGFPIWRRGADSWPYHSIHAAHALARATLAGYAVPADALRRSRAYLRAIDHNIPSEYNRSAGQALRSYALYVQALLGDHDPAEARRLLASTELEHLSAESIGWLLSVLASDRDSTETVRDIVRFLKNRVTETAGAATIAATSYDDGAYLLLQSSRRSDAVLLEAMIAAQADSDLIVKAGARAAGPPRQGALGQHAGERMDAAGDGPLLPHLRVTGARLHGRHLAG